MSATHLPSIVINILLASVPAQAQGFSSVLLVVPLAANSLGGDTYVEYTSATEAAADLTAGEISASTNLAVQVAFSQIPAPQKFIVGNVDLVGVEAYSAAIARIAAAGADFYGVCIESRLDADILDVAAAAEAGTYRAAFVSADADWLTAGFPAALSALEGKEKSLGIYHDEPVTAGWTDVALMVNRLAYNPDSRSVPWNTPLQNVNYPVTALTPAQVTALKGNTMNVVLPFGTVSFYNYQGLNFAGRQFHEIVSSDWYRVRLQENLAAMIGRLSSIGQKLPLNVDGQERAASIARALNSQGVQVGHFEAGQTEVTLPDITATDQSLFRLRLNGRNKLVGSATDLEFNIAFGNEDLS